MEDDIKTEIINAIQNRDYEIEVEETEGISHYRNYKNEYFIRMAGDGPQMGVYAGSCTVYVHEHDYTFKCDLNYGKWTLNNQKFNEPDIINILEKLEGVISGEHTDGFALAQLYMDENELSDYMTFCWEENNFLKSIDDIGKGEALVNIEYIAGSDNQKTEIECNVNDGELYKVYKYLEREERLPEESDTVTCSAKELQNISKTLYQEIVSQIEEEEGDITDDFELVMSEYDFEEQLFGEPEN